MWARTRWRILLPGPAECFTLVRISRRESALEPRDALFGRPMCELFGHHVSGSELLETVVANRRGGMQRFVGVAGIEFDFAFRRSSLLRGIMSPDAGVAVGLQLELYGV